MNFQSQIFVSIYTTIYNIKGCDTNCINAILNQSHSNFEWIIIYDSICDFNYFKSKIGNDKRVKFYRNLRKGRYYALISAIEKCNSEYVFNQDYDDVPKPFRIELQLKKLLKNPDIGAVGGWYLANYKDLNLVEEHFDQDDLEQIKRKLTFMLPFAHSFCGFRKSAILKVGGYPSDSIQEDGLLWAKLIANGYDASIVKKNIGTHFIHKNTTFGKIAFSPKREFRFLKERLRIRSILNLPFYYKIIITIRFVYRYFPGSLRSIIRQKLIGYKKI